jgi:ABC-type Fe3+/spermidine/putrescine transport system ATPase subunit
MLQVSRVSKRFEVAGDTIEALSPIDLAIGRGEFICLIGASGCGKSTLLRIIAGFETASAGAVLVAGSR